MPHHSPLSSNWKFSNNFDEGSDSFVKMLSDHTCQLANYNFGRTTHLYGPVSNNLNYRDNLLGEIKPLQTDCWKFFHSVTNGNIVPGCHTAGAISCSVQWSNESPFDYALMHWIPKIWNIAFIARSCIADFCPFWKLLLKSLLTSLFYLTVEK